MNCNNCDNQLEAGTKFCTYCGQKSSKKIATHSRKNQTNGRRGSKTESSARVKVRRFRIESTQFDSLSSEFQYWLNEKNFNFQKIKMENNDILFQIKKKGGWRKFMGMAIALNIIFCPHDHFLTVKISAGKWLDKAITGGISVFFWPLTVTTGLGMYEQMKLPNKIFNFIKNYLNN